MDSSNWSDQQFWCDDCKGALPFNLGINIENYCSCDAHYIVDQMLQRMGELIGAYIENELMPQWDQEPLIKQTQPNPEHYTIMITQAMFPQLEREINRFWKIASQPVTT